MRQIKPATLVALLVAAMMTVECGSRPPRERPVRIESDKEVAEVLATGITWFSTRVADEPQGLLLKDGDIIQCGDAALPILAGDGVVLKVTFDEWSTRLSGAIVSVTLSDEGLRWLEGASERDLAALRLVSMPESLPDAPLPALKRLADVNPNVGLAAPPGLHHILPLFEPRLLILGNDASDIRLHLANLKRLETVYMAASDSGCLEFLPALPRLHRLALVNWSANAGPLPAGMDRLRVLSVNRGDAMNDPSALRGVPAALEELSLLEMDDLDLSQLSAFPSLRTLILNESEVSGDLSGLAKLKGLERVGLPKNITQQQFEALVASHPDLKIIEIVRADSVADLSPLRRLKGLEGLVLARPTENLDVLKDLTSLRFLGLEADTTSADRERLASIRKALPDALVVPVSPFCLGSGWILVLVPAAAAFWYLEGRSRKRMASGAASA